MIAPTRQPFPWTAELKHRLVGCGYGALGALARPAFRRSVQIDELRDARILVLKPCCLGDVVFSTALIRELRRNLPRAHLAYAVGAHSRPALNGAPVDALIDTGPVGSGPYRPRDLLTLIRRVRAGRYDACLVLERSAILALVPLLAGIPRRIGVDSFGRGFSLSVGVSPRPIRAEAELYLDLLRAIGGTVVSRALEYHPSAGAETTVERRLAESGIQGRFVVLHVSGGVNPGLTLTRKRWPPDHFVALARRVVAAGARVVLVGAPEDREAAERVRQEIEKDQAIPATSQPSFPLVRPGFPLPRPLPQCAGEGSYREWSYSMGPGSFEGDRESCTTLRSGSPPPRTGGGAGGEGTPDSLLPPSALRSRAEGDPGAPLPPSQSNLPSFHDFTGDLTLDELAALARRASAYVGIDSGPSHLAEAAGARVVMLFGPTDPLLYGPRAENAVAVTSGLWCSPCFEDGRVAPCMNVRCMPSISVERVWREVARFLDRDVRSGNGPGSNS